MFTTTLINIEEFNSSLLTIDKNCAKIVIFTILDISQLKKLVVVKIYSVNPLYLINGRVDGHIEFNSVEHSSAED